MLTDITPPSIPGLEVEGPLGQDPTAVVFLARDSDGPVSLTVGRQSTPANQLAELTGWAHRYAEVRHVSGGVVPLVASGLTEQGLPFLGFRGIGATLSDWLLASRILSSGEAIRLAHRLAGTLAHAHARGIAHGAIRPSVVTIVEFDDGPGGDAQLAGFDVSAPVLGIPIVDSAYLAPEQTGDNATATPSGDIYALAATIYTGLGGQLPWVLPNRGKPGDPRTWPLLAIAGVPTELIELLGQAMSPNPAARPSAVALTELLAALESRPVVAGVGVPPTVRSQVAGEAPVRPLGRSRVRRSVRTTKKTRTPRRRARLAVLTVVLFVAVLALAVGTVWVAQSVATRATAGPASPSPSPVSASPTPTPTPSESPVIGVWSGEYTYGENDSRQARGICVLREDGSAFVVSVPTKFDATTVWYGIGAITKSSASIAQGEYWRLDDNRFVLLLQGIDAIDPDAGGDVNIGTLSDGGRSLSLLSGDTYSWVDSPSAITAPAVPPGRPLATTSTVAGVWNNSITGASYDIAANGSITYVAPDYEVADNEGDNPVWYQFSQGIVQSTADGRIRFIQWLPAGQSTEDDSVGTGAWRYVTMSAAEFTVGNVIYTKSS